jgi:hypothetical protein
MDLLRTNKSFRGVPMAHIRSYVARSG